MIKQSLVALQVGMYTIGVKPFAVGSPCIRAGMCMADVIYHLLDLLLIAVFFHDSHTQFGAFVPACQRWFIHTGIILYQ